MEQHLFPSLERCQTILHQYGFNLIRALVCLLIGLLVMKFISRGLNNLMKKPPLPPASATTAASVAKTLLLLVVQRRETADRQKQCASLLIRGKAAHTVFLPVTITADDTQ